MIELKDGGRMSSQQPSFPQFSQPLSQPLSFPQSSFTTTMSQLPMSSMSLMNQLPMPLNLSQQPVPSLSQMAYSVNPPMNQGASMFMSQPPQVSSLKIHEKLLWKRADFCNSVITQ